ncbi:MAG: hypothetical protein JSR58_03995 [Verrucomicrobia bacterium]|nr:hypothetical protein [Verrucomicrobiota bacterium]
MRIFNDEADCKLDSVTLFLTERELRQLISYARQLIERPLADHHHLSSEDYQKEITICIYNEEDSSNFSTRAQKLIKEDR